jgi:hypothetical protein
MGYSPLILLRIVVLLTLVYPSAAFIAQFATNLCHRVSRRIRSDDGTKLTTIHRRRVPALLSVAS